MREHGEQTLVHVITGLEDGGAEGALFRLVTLDTQYNHHVISLTDDGKYGSLLRDSGISVTSLNISGALTLLQGVKRLRNLIRRQSPVAVQTWMYHADVIGGISARLAGVKNVFWGVRGTNFSKVGGYNSAHIMARIAAPLSYMIPRKIIAVAESSIEAHRAMKFDTKKMIVVHNGYDFSSFYPDEDKREAFRSEIGIRSDVPIIGYVARFNKQKDHRTLLRALGKIKRATEFHLVLVGTNMDGENQELVQMIHQEQLDGRVSLLGPRQDIPTVMNGLDFHVLSSAFGEGFPNVLAEAMACGTPCVTTDVGDAALIVANYGWVVPHTDPNGLAEAITHAMSELTENPDAYASRAAVGADYVRTEFSIERMIAGFHQVWTSIR